MDGWPTICAAYLEDDHPHGNPSSSDFDASGPLIPGRFSRSETLPAHLTRDEIERVRRRAVTADAA
ncbi:hypothetical protein A9W97_20660 [Mycobacterium gordonae]|nr:hypothetical protein A9W97_20660 [Mycobacterium gordonae]